jgi:hypothetical protein
MIEELSEKAEVSSGGPPISPRATTNRDEKSSHNQEVTSKGGV